MEGAQDVTGSLHHTGDRGGDLQFTAPFLRASGREGVELGTVDPTAEAQGPDLGPVLAGRVQVLVDERGRVLVAALGVVSLRLLSALDVE